MNNCSQNNDRRGSEENQSDIVLRFKSTRGKCPSGEKTGEKNIQEKKIPVLSCEGPCIRGEIARLAANTLSKKDGFARGCYGELFTVPGSAISRWIRQSEKILMIDGCFLKCQGRLLEGIINECAIDHYDALSYYNKYSEFFDIDEVPENERKAVAGEVAERILEKFV